MATDVRRTIEAFAAPLFGVVGYRGRRWVARWGAGWIALAHGDGSERVDVGVLLSRPASSRPRMAIDVYDTLGTELLLARHEDDLRPGSHVEAPARDTWAKAGMHVDGTDEPCHMLMAEPCWISFVERAFGWIYVESRGPSLSSVRIARLSDPTDYCAD